MENQPKPLKTYKNRHGTMKNQSGTIKTNLELYRVVMGGSGGYRRFPGGSDHFSWHTHRHCIIIYISSSLHLLHSKDAVTGRHALHNPASGNQADLGDKFWYANFPGFLYIGYILRILYILHNLHVPPPSQGSPSQADLDHVMMTTMVVMGMIMIAEMTEMMMTNWYIWWQGEW